MDLEDIDNFQTPEWVMDIMIKEIPVGIREILEPTKGAGNFVKRLENNGYYVYSTDGDYFKMNHKVDRYECIVGNPPFTPMQKGYDILFDVMDRSKNIVMLMPWLTLINSQKRLDRIMDFGLKKIIHLPRKAFKGSRVQTCILVLEHGFAGDTVFSSI